jgi:hypothetical protein
VDGQLLTSEGRVGWLLYSVNGVSCTALPLSEESICCEFIRTRIFLYVLCEPCLHMKLQVRIFSQNYRIQRRRQS